MVNNYDKALDYEAALEDVRDFIDTIEVKELQVKESAEFQHVNGTCKENGNSLTQEPVSEELEEASRNYTDNEEYGDDVYFSIKASFQAGAKWQKEQMMANAFEGAYIRRNRYTKKNVLNGFDVTCDAIQGFKDKDKVKVIVIKEG